MMRFAERPRGFKICEFRPEITHLGDDKVYREGSHSVPITRRRARTRREQGTEDFIARGSVRTLAAVSRKERVMSRTNLLMVKPLGVAVTLAAMAALEPISLQAQTANSVYNGVGQAVGVHGRPSFAMLMRLLHLSLWEE